MSKYNKFWVASVVPVLALIWPYVSDGFDVADLGPVVIAVLGAFGVYVFPNQPAGATRADFR